MKKLLISAFALTLMSGVAQAESYQATNWMTPSHILNEFPYQKFAADLKQATNGEIDFEVYSSGSLVPAPTTMQGIADGVAQLGIVYPGYNPSELPLNNVINDLVFVSDDDIAAAFAWVELGLTNKKLQGEWQKNGGLFVGGYATPVYNFVCMKEVSTPETASGLKIRTAGTAQTAWVQELGAIPVSVPIADVYSGLERGSLDCTMTDPTNLDKGNKFWEVAKTINKLPMGVVLGATYVYNTDFWNELTPENRRAIFDQTAVGLARSQVAYHVGVKNALEGSAERGLKITDAHPEMQAKLETFKKSMIEKLAQRSMDERKIEDPSDVIANYLELQTKWKGLVANVDRTDADALAKVVQDNIYSKLDEKTFGVN